MVYKTFIMPLWYVVSQGSATILVFKDEELHKKTQQRPYLYLRKMF